MPSPQLQTAEIGIQVNIDEDEFNFICDEVHQDPNLEQQEDENEFKQFVVQNTEKYGNGKMECLLCGEICKSYEEMTSHIRTHRRPKELCQRCGVCVDNSQILAFHNCEGKQNCKKRKGLHCPLYNCSAKAISSVELCEHINEHTKTQNYRCLGCLKEFSNIYGYTSHIPKYLKCLLKFKKPYPYPRFHYRYDGAYRCRFIHRQAANKFYVIKRSLTYYDKHLGIQECQICLKKFASKFLQERHMKRCVQAHIKQVKIKRRTATHNIFS